MQSILKTNTRHIFSSIVYVQRSLSTHLNTPWRTAYGGFVAGSNYGDHYAIFEQGTRNTGVGIAGKNIANPSGILFAAANMLKYLGLDQHCSVIKKAVLNTIQEHNIKTPDIGGTATTTQFIECVLNEIVKMTPTIGFHYEMQKPTLAFRYKNID
ncbi:unnamed protein product [Rotaria socialis]